MVVSLGFCRLEENMTGQSLPQDIILAVCFTIIMGFHSQSVINLWLLLLFNIFFTTHRDFHS